MSDRFALEHPFLLQHVQLSRQAWHGGLHVGDAHRRLPELALREADVIANGGDGRLRRAHGLSCGIPAVGGKGQLIVDRLELGLRILYRGIGVVQNSLRIGHSLCRLIDLLRIIGRLGSRKLSLRLGQDIGVLRDGLVLQIQLLGQHVGSRRQASHGGVYILHTCRGQVEFALRQPKLIADTRDSCLRSAYALRRLKPAAVGEGQLGIASVNGLFRLADGSLCPGERRLRVVHSVGGLADQVGVIHALRRGLLLPRRLEDVLVFLNGTILELKTFLQEHHLR